jgi:rod shape-determining protein MreD
MNKKRRFLAVAVNVLLLITFFALRYSGLSFLSIGQAVPLILLPLAVSISIFYSENIGLLTGLITGAFMDSVSTESSCFNTIFMVIACMVCGLLSSTFLNKNLKAAICLSVGASFAYFILKYLIFFSFFGMSVDYSYFTLYLIPSAVYTSVWIIPFYFLNKKLSERA